MSNNKVYKVSSEDLDKVTKALNLCATLLAKIAMSDILDSAELPDPTPATLERTVEDKLEVALDRVEEKAHRCHCHRIHGDKHAVTTCPTQTQVTVPTRKPAKRKPLPKSLKEVAAYTGATYKKVHKYAYTHNIGKAGHTLDGHQCRILSEADVKALIEHFKK